MDYELKVWIRRSAMLLNVSFFLLLFFQVIHESGHVWDLKRQNVEINDVCFLGIGNLNEGLMLSASGWVRPDIETFKKNYNNSFGCKWDFWRRDC